MKLLKYISWISLVVLVTLSGVLEYSKIITKEQMNLAMLIGTILWFVITPIWMKAPQDN